MAEKHLKYSIFLMVREMQSKQPWHFTIYQSEWLRSKSQVTADFNKDIKKEENSFIAGQIANWYKHSGNQSGRSSDNLK